MEKLHPQAVAPGTQTNGRPLQLVHSLEEDLPGLHWPLVDLWDLLGWADHQGHLWEFPREAQEDLQGQCFRQDIDLMVQDQVGHPEGRIVGVHQAAGLQVHLEMLHGRMEVLLAVVQVQGAREDLLIAGHHPLGWEDGEFPHGALLVVLALFPRLEDGEEDLQGSGDHLELLGHPHRMDQTSQQPVREITTWQKSSPCLLRLPRRLRVRHSCQDIFQDQMSKLSSPGLDM